MMQVQLDQPNSARVMAEPTEEWQAADAVLSAARSQLHLLTSAARPELLGHQLAAAALKRCLRLAAGMTALGEAGLPDLLGLLSRALWENWLIGTYALLAPEEAVDLVAGSHKQQARKLNDALQLGKEETLASWDAEEATLKWEQAARHVTELLRKSGDADADVAATYDIVFRGESILGTHAGIGTLGPYLVEVGDRIELSTEPPSPIDLEQRHTHAAAEIGHLASRTFEEFGISTAELDAAWEQLTAISNERLEVDDQS